MSVEVRIPQIFRNHTGGERLVKAEGAIIAELLDNLEENYPGLKGRLFAGDGQLHQFLNIFLNDEDIRYLGSLNTKLSDGDVISILPAVAGGQEGGR